MKNAEKTKTEWVNFETMRKEIGLPKDYLWGLANECKIPFLMVFPSTRMFNVKQVQKELEQMAHEASRTARQPRRSRLSAFRENKLQR